MTLVAYNIFIIVDVFIQVHSNIPRLTMFRLCYASEYVRSISIMLNSFMYIIKPIHYYIVFLMPKHCCGYRTLIFSAGGETGSDDLKSTHFIYFIQYFTIYTYTALKVIFYL